MLTTQRQVRRAFWQWVDEFKPTGVSRRKIAAYDGAGKMYNTDTRCAFCDWLDAEDKRGNVASGLADRATL